MELTDETFPQGDADKRAVLAYDSKVGISVDNEDIFTIDGDKNPYFMFVTGIRVLPTIIVREKGDNKGSLVGDLSKIKEFLKHHEICST